MANVQSNIKTFHSIIQWLYSSLLGLGRFFSFIILYAVDRTPWTGDQPVARLVPTRRTAQTQNKRIQTSMPQVVFETTTPAIERDKTVNAIDCAATVMDIRQHYKRKYLKREEFM
jgi:hypothetical protein